MEEIEQRLTFRLTYSIDSGTNRKLWTLESEIAYIHVRSTSRETEKCEKCNIHANDLPVKKSLKLKWCSSI